MNDETIRTSILAPYIDGLLNEKHAAGYSYRSEELILNRFDSYCVRNGLETTRVTKDFLGQWMEQSPAEGGAHKAKRVSVVRQLMLFMAAMGISVYIPHDFCHFGRTAPHIFDPVEIRDFFDALDSNPPTGGGAYLARLHNEYRMLFRLYCSTGMRNSEAAGMELSCVDFADGVLTVLDSKGRKDRLVYLADDVKADLSRYHDYIHSLLGDCRWLFPGMDPSRPIPNTSVDSVFNRFWKLTPHAGCSNKPTVHDFRFTFVVNRMNLWAEQGLDIHVMMPYLSRYLGHKSINETFYYYFLAKDAYRTVALKDTIATDVIPEVDAHG